MFPQPQQRQTNRLFCQLTLAGQTIPDNTITELIWTDVLYQEGIEGLLIPVTGLYLVNVVISYAAAANGARDVRLLSGPTILAYEAAAGSTATGQHLSLQLIKLFNLGERLAVQTLQNSGGPLAIQIARPSRPRIEVCLLG